MFTTHRWRILESGSVYYTPVENTSLVVFTAHWWRILESGSVYYTLVVNTRVL